MKLEEEIRSWLIQEKIGLISIVELIKLVDEKIIELDEPPYYLIAISLKEEIYHIPKLDLIKFRVENKDCALIADKMLSLLHKGTISYDEIRLVSSKMCKVLGVQEDSYFDFDWIDDEVYLMNRGDKEKERSMKEINNRLIKIKTL